MNIRLIALSLLSISCNIFIPICLGFEENADQREFQKTLVASGRYQLWGEKDLTVPLVNAQGSLKNVQDLQPLTYLQGYEPAPLFKNVIYYDKKLSLNGYNLLVSAHAPQAQLMDMRGNILHQWRFDCGSLPDFSKEYCTDNWVKASLLPHGDLLALLPYVGLLKINKGSGVIWFYKTIAHHDFTVDKKGRVFLLTMRQFKMPNGLPIIDEFVTILSPDGKKEKEISMIDLLKNYPDHSYYDQLFIPILKNRAFYKKNDPNSLVLLGDCLHSNSIRVLKNAPSSGSGIFKNGYLLISILRLRILIVVDPQKERIVQIIGPNIWKSVQHNAHLLENGDILIFQNYYTNDLSRIIEFDPLSHEIKWDYDDKNMPFFSKIYGGCSRLANGNTLIIDSTHGHAFEVTHDKKIVWDFYSPYRVGKNNDLCALLYQMQRIPGNTDLKWLGK